MRRASYGFTLAELLLSLFIMGFLVFVALLCFNLTSNLMGESLVRQSTENQLRAVKALLERDFSLANGWYIDVLPRRGEEARDALSLPTLADWHDPTEFSLDTGLPAWNRYIVWYVNRAPSGVLVRQVVAPERPELGYFNVPYEQLSTNLSESDPLSNDNVVFSQVLSRSVKEFEVSAFPGATFADVKLRFEATGARRGGGMDQVEDQVEVQLRFDINNTWPKL